MLEFKKVSELVQNKCTINLCSSRSEPLKILQWQPCGKFEADNSAGVKLETELFIDKAYKFVHLAKENCADVVLTPEYCFPYKVLNDIICDKNLWPENGWLWCFGTQGYSRKGFKSKLEAWDCCKDVIVLDYAFNKLEPNVFISPLIYLFRDDSDQLYILPQFKTGTMKDPWHDFEADGLCKGNTIFVFDLCSNETCKNAFLSIICADASYNIADYIKDDRNVIQDNIILFHPQLNQKPRHLDFRNVRNSLIYNNGKKARIITLNWAENTITYISDKPIIFNRPFSALYLKSTYSEYDEAHRLLRRKNFKNGTFYAYNKEAHTDIWYSHRSEHCKLFYINKGYYTNGSSAVTGWEEPNTKQCFVFEPESRKWKPEELPCRYSLSSIVYSKGVDYDYPLTICEKSSETCTMKDCCVDKCDFFFSLCFGGSEKLELITKNELVERMVVGSDEESDGKRRQKTIKYYNLIEMLKKNRFPKCFSHFIDNHKFEIHDSFPYIGTDCYNLVQKNEDPNSRDLKALVVIVDDIHEESKIRKLIEDLTVRFDRRYRQHILVYYIPYGETTYTYYDKHLLQTSASKWKFSKDQASYFKSEI